MNNHRKHAMNITKVGTPKIATFWFVGTLEGLVVTSEYRKLKRAIEKEQMCN